MRERAPGESLIQEVLRHQSSARPRTTLERLVGRSPLTADATPWFTGARGEIEVGSILAQLPPEWTVLHSVPFGAQDSDIDHVIIGPGGVFTVNTKHHRGQEVWVAGRTLLVAGQRQPYIRKAQHEAAVVEDLLALAGLDCRVEPLLVVVGAQSVTVRARPEAVHVVETSELLRWLLKRRMAVPADRVPVLVRVLERPAMWRPTAILSESDRAAFAALDREVRSARRTRLGWALSPAAAVVALAVPSIVGSMGRWLPGL